MDWDFSTNQEVDEETLGKAPEGYRSAYEKGDDGKYKIADAYRPYVDAITGLGSALKSERGVSKTLKGQKDAAALIKEQLGFDTLEEAKAKLDELNGQVATASKVDPAKIKADIEKTFNGQMAEKDQQLVKMQGTLSKYMVESAAIGALAAAKGNSKLLMPLVREQVELVEDGGEYVVRVKDGQGDYRGDGRGGFLTIEGLVAEMQQSKDYAAAFESDQQGGTPPSRQPGQQQQRQLQRGADTKDMTAAQRIERGLEARRRGQR